MGEEEVVAEGREGGETSAGSNPRSQGQCRLEQRMTL